QRLHEDLLGIAPASRGIERELRKRNSDSGASAGMEFRKRNSKGRAIRASANCGHPRKRGRRGWQQGEVHHARACVGLGNPSHHHRHESGQPSDWQRVKAPQ
ncbi:hypothetical protein AB0L96_38530, partial [Streptomyces sp. NPDC052115]|uniref:hypothetical protein n=1 Tax=Streptomyces sp. NPDC052115 TaxID=3155794 RepID=UPI00341CC88B